VRAVITIGDARGCLERLPDGHFHGILSDPPYGVGSMERSFGWDESIPSVEEFRELYRMTKPGGHLLCFGHATTFGFLWMNIHQAGWQIMDTLMWLFSKRPSLPMYVGKAIDRELGAEREPIGINPGWKPRNWKAYGEGAFANPVYLSKPATPQAAQFEGYANRLRTRYDPIILARKPRAGSFANNALTHGIAGLNIGACRIPANDKAKFAAGYPAGRLYPITQQEDEHPDSRYPGNVLFDEDVASGLDASAGAPISRFFSVLDEPFLWVPQPEQKEKAAGLPEPTDHPCVKPIKLTQWLARLILPPTKPTRLLVPYSGVGSEMIGGLLAGWDSVYGIEINERYVRQASDRLKYWLHRQGDQNFPVLVRL